MTKQLTIEQKLKLKQQLKTACSDILQQRIFNAQEAMQQAQESANSEEKSSAGDKHETSRAMSQLDRDMHAKQEAEAKQEMQLLYRLNADVLNDNVKAGTVVICKDHSFFISLGLGTIQIEQQKFISLSPKAPIAKALDMKKAGDHFLFNGKTIEIMDVF